MTPMDASDLFELCEDGAGQEVLQDLLTMSHPLNMDEPSSDGTSTHVYEGVFSRSVLWHTQSFESGYKYVSSDK